MYKEARKLKLFELGRALSYTSDILEMIREKKLLESKLECIEKEGKDWKDYKTDIESEKSLILQIKTEINEYKTELQTKIEELEEKIDSYREVVQGLCNYIFSKEADDIELARDEIDINFIEEYIFIMCEIELNGNRYIRFDQIFEDSEYFAKLLFKYYGEYSFKLVVEILQDSEFSENFEYYFKE